MSFALAAPAVAATLRPIDVTDQAAPVFSVYTAQDGLSEEIWNVVDVDAEGFAWAGLASSLARFDGYRWTLWPVRAAKLPWSVFRMVEQVDDQGRSWIWAASNTGLARFDGERWQRLSIDGIPSDGYRTSGNCRSA